MQVLWLECGLDPDRLLEMPLSRLMLLYHLAADWLDFKARKRKDAERRMRP